MVLRMKSEKMSEANFSFSLAEISPIGVVYHD
jgi:hypothetical protein